MQNYVIWISRSDEVNNFIGKYNLQKFTPVETESLNQPISKEIEKLLNNYPTKISSSPDNFLGNSTKYPKTS